MEEKVSAYERVMAHARQTQALEQVMGRLGWDQETMMPRGASTQRGEEMAALETVLHARRADPDLGLWLSQAQAPDAAGAAQLRETQKAYDRARKLPADLAAEIAKTTSLAQGQWAQARANEDLGAFLPVLAQVIALRQQEADALATKDTRYDTLLQDYEPGTSAAELETMFGALRPGLVALRDKVLAASRPKRLEGKFSPDQQRALAQDLAESFGYDLNRGRIDLAVHPFSSGSGDDVRITTRVDPNNPFDCLFSTLHEVGHACYEQNIDPAYRLSPLGSGVSMGVHESQSRIYENQLGRSQAFCAYLYDRMRARFGDIGLNGPDEFYRAVNHVHPGFIRTEADEVHYNLHILIRFDLERALIAGDLQVGDLEAAWNDRFQADFGAAVDKPSNGCLQDVHWSVGLFGYFPTYSLGNVYAGCLFQALHEAIPDLDAHLRKGETGHATAWLRENVQCYGKLRAPRETIAQACGFEPNETPLLSYLNDKFTSLVS